MKEIRKKLSKGTMLYSQNLKAEEICILLSGKIMAVGNDEQYDFYQGSVIGIIDGIFGTYMFNYFLTDDCEVILIPYEEGPEILDSIMKYSKNNGNMVVTACHYAASLMARYTALLGYVKNTGEFLDKKFEECKRLYQVNDVRLPSFSMEWQEKVKNLEELETEDAEYVMELQKIDPKILTIFFNSNYIITKTHLVRLLVGCESMMESYTEYADCLKSCAGKLMLDEKENVYSLYIKLYFELKKKNADTALIEEKMQEIFNFVMQCREMDQRKAYAVKNAFDSQVKKLEETKGVALEESQAGENSRVAEIRELVKGSLETIISFAGLPEERALLLRQSMNAYVEMEDKSEQGEEQDQVRKNLLTLFYEYYQEVFLLTQVVKEYSPVIDLFLNYGYMDERLVADSVIEFLIDKQLNQRMGKFQMFTMREWLHEIYVGNHEPSKNEFDTDYVTLVREERRNGTITPEQEKGALSDKVAKVEFELQNMLKSANKVTHGKALIYCPVLCMENEDEDVKRLLIQKSVIRHNMDEVLQIDYSCFYRDILFWDTDHGIKKEYIAKEVMPIIILMPNIGTRGIMWQELSGIKKDTPARFAFPILSREDPMKMVLQVLGDYRWEICRNIQGIYWNDISEKSLTSEYCDYAQFYKKNRDLTPQVKEKIRLSLSKARNSFKTMFIMDYINWITCEAKGISKLNRITREILAMYCPLPSISRQSMIEHPVFEKAVARFERSHAEKQRRADAMKTAIRRSDGKVPPELQSYFEYLEY